MKIERGEIERENPEIETLKKEIRRLRYIIAEIDEEISALDKVLGPVWSLEDVLKDEIRETLSYGNDGRAQWSFMGVGARQNPFARLFAIALEWGSVKTERKQLQHRVNAYQREAKGLRKQLEKLEHRPPPKPKKPSPQKDLF